MKKFGLKIVLLKLELLFIKATLMIHSFFRSKHDIKKLRNHLNCQHKDIRFTSETKNENSISFFEIKISRDNDKFTTSVYCKPTFSRILTNSGDSSRSHINTSCSLPYYTEHSNFAQILNVFITKLTC